MVFVWFQNDKINLPRSARLIPITIYTPFILIITSIWFVFFINFNTFYNILLKLSSIKNVNISNIIQQIQITHWLNNYYKIYYYTKINNLKIKTDSKFIIYISYNIIMYHIIVYYIILYYIIMNSNIQLLVTQYIELLKDNHNIKSIIYDIVSILHNNICFFCVIF